MFALSMGVFHHNPLYRTVVDGRHEQMAKRFKQNPLCEGTLYVINLVVCRCAGKR